MSGAPCPKPTRTAWTETAGREAVHLRSMSLCEAGIPGVCHLRATNVHHRVNRSQGGAWAPPALLDLCGSGTTGCHGYITHEPAWAVGAGLAVPRGGDPETTPVYLHVQPWWTGWWLLTLDGLYQHDGALDAARALGMPENPYALKETA